MRFYTETECEGWCQQLEVPLDDERRPLREPIRGHRLRCEFPSNFSQSFWLSRCVESALQPRNDCLLWVTNFGTWPSSENYHLYYRLRQSYGDFRLLGEAPGHLCLGYEQPDVISLIQICLLFGWDAHLIPTVGYAQAFISHDEWIAIGFDDRSQFDETRQALEGAKLKVSVA
jgi:hypothetical protein